MQHIIRHSKRWTLRLLGAFFGLILAYVLTAFMLGFLSTSPSSQNTVGTIPIFIRTNGMHTDFLLPAEHSPIAITDFEQENKTAKHAQFVAFGWGDKGFYLEVPTLDKITFGVVFDALFFRSSTLMHVSFYPFTPKESEYCKKLFINQEQLKVLQNHIQESFQKNQDNQRKVLEGKGYGKRDEFYEAVGRYSFLNTCNVWTNTGLKKMGIPTAVWSPFDTAIFWHLNRK